MLCAANILQYIPYSGNVWQIAQLKVIGKKKFGEWIDFGHKDTIYKLKFGWLKFDKSQMIRQICLTFPLPNIPTTLYGTQTHTHLVT